MTHWRLHVTIGATTFLLFPLLGLSLFVVAPHLLPQPLFLGVLFICALPSTVQSSIALISIAGGNVPSAVCAATVLNIAGIALAPLLFGAMTNLRGGGIDFLGDWQVSLRLLVPFAAGDTSAFGRSATARCSRPKLSIASPPHAKPTQGGSPENAWRPKA